MGKNPLGVNLLSVIIKCALKRIHHFFKMDIKNIYPKATLIKRENVLSWHRLRGEALNYKNGCYR